MLSVQFLLSLLLLAMSAPTHAWSRPVWYQVGLDLQPWGCQPEKLDGCRGPLGCPGYWIGLGGNRIYPVAGITITTTMMLVISRVMMQRKRSPQLMTGPQSQVTPSPSGPWKRRATVSDRTLLLGVLHMLDALLIHIESHLQCLATKQQMQIKVTPT
ncbi:transmembrane protein 89 [Perognathus longimembris pacificus]|uniref:transmembrane protein 89 n=1 Tax=Perognathus longimembris pacificus TaxID=214514 RepID=UPI002019C075|nr:transmembrane protein 89 [Perognathus longimembris pacificus]